MRGTTVVLLLGLLPIVVACGPSMNSGNVEADAGAGCTAHDNGDRTTTITCDGGRSVTVSNELFSPPGDASVASLPCTTLTRDVTLATNDDWVNLAALGCTMIAGTLRIDAPGLTLGSATKALTLPGVIGVGHLYVRDNLRLATLSLPSLTSVDGDLTVNNYALTTLSLPALTTVNGVVSITSSGFIYGGRIDGAGRLANLNLPALTRVVGDLEVTGIVAATLRLPSLATVRGNLIVNGNNGSVLGPTADTPLAILNLPVLTVVGGRLSVDSNGALTSLSLPALTSVADNLSVTGNTELPSLSLPVLATVGGALTVGSNPAMTSVSLPVLTAVGYYQAPVNYLSVSGNTALTSLSLPELAAVAGNLSVHNNAELRQCVVDALRLQITTGPTSYTASDNNGMPNTCP